MPRTTKHTPTHTPAHPLITIALFILIVFSVGEAFYLTIGKQRNASMAPTETPIIDQIWQTYTNATEHFSFQHPVMINGPMTIRDDRVEIYEEVGGLMLLINSIPATDPAAWLRTHTTEDYSKKPIRCFSVRSVMDIYSANNQQKILLHFDHPVLFLDNIDSIEGKQGACANNQPIRLLLIPHDGHIIRMTFSGDPISERMVSSFKLTQ